MVCVCVCGGVCMECVFRVYVGVSGLLCVVFVFVCVRDGDF